MGEGYHPVEEIPIEDLARIKAAAATKPKLLLFIEIAEATGLRISEALSLDAEQLLEPGDGWRVRPWVKVRQKGGYVEPVHFPPGLRQTITEFLDVRGWRTGPLFRRYKTSALRMSRQAMYSLFTRIQEGLGFDRPYHPHQLRHTYGTYVADRGGGDPYLVAKALRHHDIRSSFRYIHVPDYKVQEVLANF